MTLTGVDRSLKLQGHIMSRHFSAWQKLVALAPLLLLAIYLPGQAMLRCRIDGQLRPTCCCPPDGRAQEAGPVLKAQDCCDQVVSATQRPVVAAARVSAVDPVAVVVATALIPSVVLSLAAPPRSTWTGQALAPPRDGPPLVLLKHAFLI
jgi:hypothetical protein